jgi:hypothetical protein
VELRREESEELEEGRKEEGGRRQGEEGAKE